MNEEERYLFDLRGYIIIEGVLSVKDIEELNATIDGRHSWEALSHSKHVHTGMDEYTAQRGNSDPMRGPVDLYSGLLLDWGEGFRRLVGHKRLLPYLTELVGENCKLAHLYAIFMKKGNMVPSTHALHGGATPHEPGEYYSFRDGLFYNGLIAISFALTDAPLGTGGFCCIPGSHKSELPVPSSFQNVEQPAPCVMQLPVKAGDVIIFTEALCHGCLAWTAEHERRALIFKYCPRDLQYER